MSSEALPVSKVSPDWLVGGGEMGARMRALDWKQTPLGPVESWSPTLKMMTRFLLVNRMPILLWWGPQFCQLYNDAYRPILGAKHPQFLGRPTSECWAEIWDILRPLIETPFNGGPPTWMEDIELELNRYGFTEETHFTIAYSPVPDESVDGGIGGVIATVHEITEKVVGERRLVVLRELGTRAVEAKTAEEACAVAVATLGRYSKDVPFAVLYLMDDEAKQLRLAGAAGVAAGTALTPLTIDLESEQPWPLAAALQSETAQTVDDLATRFGAEVPTGPWSDPPREAVVTLIRSNVSHQPAGVLIAGISSRLRLDDSYLSFIELAATQIATAVANARAYEEERKRAEALAEIDRAKIAFFSNVSHEFRTPLTLMLGPLEDVIQEQHLPQGIRERLSLAHRNSLRLLKLVNSLLDFSRIEAGRIEAVYEPVDLSALTTELASNFRSAIERAGLSFVVSCERLPDNVFVDREMWEKIVLNLLSNAFKFTLEGEIKVELRQAGEMVQLSIIDTGNGIPAEALPHVFERFHRVKGARGRSYEGSGIGLALVQELVSLHGGTVSVRTEVDRGSTFMVEIPLGKAHLPAERIGAGRHLPSTAQRGQSYVEEALRWLQPTNGNHDLPISTLDSETSDLLVKTASLDEGPRKLILLADDNADMRDYVRRLLSTQYDVTAVSNGREALRAAREHPPDLVVADVMMPELDGFGLLNALRLDRNLRSIPVVMLSARAGEDSRVEGLEAGADDYLVKPFAARELLARVSSSIVLAEMRNERRKSEHARERAEAKNLFLVQLDDAIRPLDDPQQITLRAARILGQHLQVDRCAYADVEPDEDSMYLAGNYLRTRSVKSIVGKLKFADFGSEVLQLMRADKPFVANDVETHVPAIEDLASYEATQIRSVICVPLHKRGKFVAAMAVHMKTPRVWTTDEVELVQLVAARCWESIERARVARELRESETLYRAFVTASTDAVYRMSADWSEMRQLNGRQFIADTQHPSGEWVQKYIMPEDQNRVLSAIKHAILTRSKFELEHRVIRRDGTSGWTFSRAIPILDEVGEIREWIGTASDVTRRKEAEGALRDSEEKYRTLLGSMDEGLMIAEVMFDETGSEAIDYLVLETNEAFYKHTGLPRGMVGKTISEIVGGAEVPWLGIYGGVALTGEATRFEYEITVEPLVGWYDIFIQRIGEPHHHRVAVMFQEITERKRVEESIAKQNERLTLLWEAAGVLLTTDDPDAMLTSLFSKIRKTLSLDVYFNFMVTEPGDALGLVSYSGIAEETARSISRLEFGQAICGRVALQHKAIVATEIQESDEPMVQLVKGFGVRAYACNPLMAGDRLLGTLSFASRTRDHFEPDEIEFLETISKYVTAAYERLRLIEQLRDEDRRKDEFLATLAHELRNPLAPMNNGLQLMRLAANNPGTLEQARAMMERQLQQMKRLVDDLLDVSRISRNKLELRKEFVELATVVNRATETSRPLIEAAAQELLVTLPEEPVLLDADPVRLAQAFSNLLNNASKYSEKGSRIWFQVEHAEEEIIVKVRDNGIGIPADKLPRIFDIFMQVDRSIERSQGGLGIGLTLVRQLVQMHGGSVEVGSDGPGRGSEFIVRLPVVILSKPAAPSESENKGAERGVAARRILVADDNRDSADSLAMMLEMLGHSVSCAHDGLEALEMAKRTQPELVFLDLGMPRMNGYDAARLIRSQPECNGAVLVALTGWGQEEDRRRSYEAGFDYHIVKPIDFTTVENLLKNLNGSGKQ
jgi:signal transduction histidine kinase/DNA-binding response OmpR family regulator/PAS domain-containing protein